MMSHEIRKSAEVSSQILGGGKRLSGSVRFSRTFFAVLAVLFVACVILQVFLAGLAIFTDTAYWSGHTIFVRFFSFLPLAMLIFSIIGRLPKDLISISVVMFALIIAQYLTASLSATFGIIASLHVIFALMLFGGSTTLLRRAWRWAFGKNTKVPNAEINT